MAVTCDMTSRILIADDQIDLPALEARLTAAMAAFTGGRLQDDATSMVLAGDQG